MAIELISCALISNREKFQFERFSGTDYFLILVKSGLFSLVSPNGTYTIGPNEAALFLPNVQYLRQVIEPVTIFIFRFRGDEAAFPTEHVQFSDTARVQSTMSLLEKNFPMLSQDVFQYQMHLFKDLIHLYALEHMHPFLPVHRHDPLVEAAVGYLNASLHRHVVIKDLAKYTGLSYVQFLRRFQAAYGISPTEYQAQLRLQKAKQLLVAGDGRITDIAYACGFENAYYFSNFFKKHTGMSPSAYRKTAIL